MNANDIREKLIGNIVPVPGQFHEDLSLNHAAYREHVQFLMGKGLKCFYLALSASEFDYMTREERVAVTKTVAETLGPDCMLIAQALGGHWLTEQLEEAKMLLDQGAQAVVIAPQAIKEGNKFFSSFYDRAGYSPVRHDSYYIRYMEKISGELKAPIVYHDKPFKSGKGPSMAMLEKIMALDWVAGLKEHVPDPVTLQRVYQTFGHRVACFDGFGKTMQFWSLQWGAQARHTCWSWFDPDSDQRFVAAMQHRDYQAAMDIVNAEWPVARAISVTGFQGYKYLMNLKGLPAGPSRIPGEELTTAHQSILEQAAREVGLIG